jgi:hypothetical protein
VNTLLMYRFQFGFFALFDLVGQAGLAALALAYILLVGTLELLSPPNITVPVVPIFYLLCK